MKYIVFILSIIIFVGCEEDTSKVINVVFNDVQELIPGDKVYFKDKIVGEVYEMKIIDSSKVRVSFKLNSTFILPDSIKFQIKTVSLIGQKGIFIQKSDRGTQLYNEIYYLGESDSFSFDAKTNNHPLKEASIFSSQDSIANMFLKNIDSLIKSSNRK